MIKIIFIYNRKSRCLHLASSFNHLLFFFLILQLNWITFRGTDSIKDRKYLHRSTRIFNSWDAWHSVRLVSLWNTAGRQFCGLSMLNWSGWYMGKGGEECFLLNWLGLIWRWRFSLLTNCRRDWSSLSVIAGLKALGVLNHSNWSAVGYMGDCAGRPTAPGHSNRFVGMVERTAAFSISSCFDLARRLWNQNWKYNSKGKD